MSRTITLRLKDLAPDMIAVKDANDTIGLLTEYEWEEAVERMDQVLIKAVEQHKKEA